ncbi:MFS transporter [Actinomadura hibisca]|uniref:MFS transporter n=1 Tax=Actinomadura hibisca TaxID=68565 RepID=UPI0012F71D1D|nr:MFS transporter [Actinomadura hibisca]
MSGRNLALSLHLTSATLLRVSAEGMAVALVLTVQARTGDAAQAGFLQTAVTLPYVLSGPVIGHVLDRTARPRRVAVGLAVGYAAATALLMAVAGRTPLLLALAVALVIGCTEPIVVAVTGLLPRFVPADRLPRAYGLESASYDIAGIAGPGLAAFLATAVGGGYAGAAIVASALLGLLALPLLPLSGPAADPPGPSRHGALDVLTGGLPILVHNRVLRGLTTTTTLAWVGWGGIPVTAVLLAQDIGAAPDWGGRLLVAMALGALAGSLLAARLLTARHAEAVMLLGLLGLALSLAALAFAPSVGWAAAGFAVAGFMEGPVFAATLILRQRESPADRLGQVNTTAGSLKIGGSAIGAALTGALAGTLGADGLVLGIAGIQTGAVALGWLMLRPGKKPR